MSTTTRYSLRPNAKGRREHQSADDPDGQMGGSCGSTTTTTSACSTGKGNVLTDDSGSATPYTPKAAPNTLDLAHDSERQRTEEDQRRSHGGITAVSKTTHHRRHHHTDMGVSTARHLTETSEEVQAGRQREEARRCAEAVRIRREQIVRGFEEDMRGLHARIAALRHECEGRVALVRKQWEQARAIERGEVAMVEEDGEVRVDSDLDADMDYEME